MPKCSTCSFARYCSVGCQREDRAVHRQECTATATAYGGHQSNKQVYYGFLEQDTFDYFHAILDTLSDEEHASASSQAL